MHDPVFQADHAVGGLEKELRLLARQRCTRLFGVVGVVIAARAEHGRGQKKRGQTHRVGLKAGSLRRIGDDCARGLAGPLSAPDQLHHVDEFGAWVGLVQIDDSVAIDKAKAAASA